MDLTKRMLKEELEALDDDSLLDHFSFSCVKYAEDQIGFRYVEKVREVILRRLANKNDPSANGPVENTYQP
ncbi:hypothetical protein [Brevibacillus laterosporus]|uniref:Uncharacterized protein n=1 Tax=Brevibacillus laterosporus TaxID=1465 RepID=A0AAP3G630_BRELA|nr:hypothetical protein [Brevibacillus laterosporus]MCR8978722.1 hypothetical protein [Brevibacillus laterosporus]MCZ0805878.1 hypothetical protein [Brevibacillus laterosporus]MCZ0824356.1 hypothetical protein [Brevibacillus laterosporus]MCZ0848260.1 hypothetical protein [Brevibacillus laterosporus]